MKNICLLQECKNIFHTNILVVGLYLECFYALVGFLVLGRWVGVAVRSIHRCSSLSACSSLCAISERGSRRLLSFPEEGCLISSDQCCPLSSLPRPLFQLFFFSFFLFLVWLCGRQNIKIKQLSVHPTLPHTHTHALSLTHTHARTHTPTHPPTHARTQTCTHTHTA